MTSRRTGGARAAQPQIPVRYDSLTYLPAAEHDPLLAGQALESDRSARVELVGRDADLRAQPVFEAVGEARGGIDHDRARIDLAQEARRVAVMLGDDGVGVLRAVLRDMVDGR